MELAERGACFLSDVSAVLEAAAGEEAVLPSLYLLFQSLAVVGERWFFAGENGVTRKTAKNKCSNKHNASEHIQALPTLPVNDQ